MRNFGELRDVILGAVSRAHSSFQAGSQNFVDVAINNALLYMQRKHDFEWLKGLVTIECNPFGNLMVGKDEEGCEVAIKRIIQAHGLTEPTFGCDQKVRYVSRTTQINDSTSGAANHCCTCNDVVVVHSGQKVWLNPQPEPKSDPYTLHFHAVKMLPPFRHIGDTNFLLEYGFDFLMYRSIVELNFWIKEDERFNISKALVEDAWMSLIIWDSSLVSPTDTEIDL